MRRRTLTAIVLTAALLVIGSASAQQYRYGHDAQRYGGTSTITAADGRGGVSSRTVIHGPASGSVVIIHPDGALTTGTIDQLGKWYTITTPGNSYSVPRALR